ncbi:23S rRNA (uracil(1939)-C(5))-methyltransferase RlmD [Wenzhouxiangella sp. AB-CW3]|uniref:23S rRNA (uracil(1939)-C(5))-methyltransferase RlmD n=1 Tax=Wenzhouxiangella sp. AB-CW3 TaxID=2771012 RepID=UPI00168BBC0A|nr:23S rRNA (uracil(1939)-C(5))-methyltransferase RlmD [Wenzhouxiangella sp. AB-CW3]QOC21268.1 23S rRNA (uracil(1939)-C(5))-methyltransferase RlmD [Wenzhouxiangella sp. AB-CW3]
MGRKRRRRLPAEPIELAVTDLSHDGRGVGRHEEKAVFVHGALPGETASARLIDRNRRFDEALCEQVIEASAERVDPECPWFDHCGGCALQHLDHSAQLEWKHKRLVDNLTRIGEVSPASWWDPIAASPWFYRRRSRLSARLVKGKGRVLVGFREPQGRFVADVGNCRVLHPDFSNRLLSLSQLLGKLSVADAVPQIETASGDSGSAIVLRHLRPLTTADEQHLRDWSAENDIAVYLQPKGPSTVHRLCPDQHELTYRLDEFDLELGFHPQNFIQVNADINRALIRRAVELLEPTADDRVLDLFCGLGNFTLPLATRAGSVVGVEGDEALVEAGRANAVRNGLDQVEWEVADLAGDVSSQAWYRAGFDAVLIDPPRSGAFEVLPVIAGSGARRVVYVSCNPATLARDAGELVNRHGFRLKGAGIADMFPHTAHVESIALFERA